MQEMVNMLYEKLVEYEVAEEMLDYIDELDEMIECDEYDKKKVIEIENKYSIETKFLLGFENQDKNGFDKNYEEPNMQVLINLRDRLYYIAVLKILEESGKEVPKDFAKRDFLKLAELIEN